jgi:hypothetical protein
MRFSSSSVFCDECPSEAKQWAAGGEEGIRVCIYHMPHWCGVREFKSPVLLRLTEQYPWEA